MEASLGMKPGSVVVVPFPFSDLSASKKRPALVLAILPGDDLILCQITSQQHSDPLSIKLGTDGFKSGKLIISSFIRCGRIFTADKGLVIRIVGQVTNEIQNSVVEKICRLLKVD